MKQQNSNEKVTKLKVSKENLLNKTEYWISEINSIKVEQHFLKELLTEHVMGLCDATNFTKAKLFLNSLKNDMQVGDTLATSFNEHKINLSLLIENVYLKKEKLFREDNLFFKNEFKRYIENYRNIKDQIFEFILLIMQLKKQQNIPSKK